MAAKIRRPRPLRIGNTITVELVTANTISYGRTAVLFLCRSTQMDAHLKAAVLRLDPNAAINWSSDNNVLILAFERIVRGKLKKPRGLLRSTRGLMVKFIRTSLTEEEEAMDWLNVVASWCADGEESETLEDVFFAHQSK